MDEGVVTRRRDEAASPRTAAADEWHEVELHEQKQLRAHDGEEEEGRDLRTPPRTPPRPSTGSPRRHVPPEEAREVQMALRPVGRR